MQSNLALVISRPTYLVEIVDLSETFVGDFYKKKVYSTFDYYITLFPWNSFFSMYIQTFYIYIMFESLGRRLRHIFIVWNITGS